MKTTGKPTPERKPAPTHRPAPTGGGIAQLVAIAKQLRLTEDARFARLLVGILRKGDERAARKLVERLQPAALAQELQPNHFLSPDTDQLDGEFLLGHTQDGQPIGLDRDELTRHVFISGQSGTGKSNLLKRLVLAASANHVHVVHFDRKGDLEHAVTEGLRSIHWTQLRWNPLCPPHRAISVQEFRNDFAQVFAELFQFYARGHAILLQGLHELYSKVYEQWPRWTWDTPFPTLHGLRTLFKSPRFAKTVKGQGLQSLYSLIDKLDSLVIELGPILDCQRGFDIVRLHRESWAINYNLDGLSVQYQNLLILCQLLSYAHLFKALGPRGQLNALIVFDEAKGLIGGKHETFMIKDLVSKVREWGIGLLCADQIPSEIGQHFFSNIGTLIMFRHSDGNDLRRLQYSAGATPDQSKANYALRPGQAIVRLMKSKDLHHLTVPYTPAEKFISREAIDRLMATHLADLAQDVLPLAEPERHPAPATKQQHTTTLAGDEAERRFLAALAKNPDRPSSQVYRALGLSNSQGHRLKTRLRKRGLISQITTNLGKGGKAAKYLAPNPLALETLGITLDHKGRGGTLHRHFQAELKKRCEALGYAATIEENLSGTGEAPDLGLHKDGRRIAVEIIVTTKPPANVAALEKCLRLGYDDAVLAFVNSQLLDKTREQATATLPAATLRRARFCLLHHVTDHLSQEAPS